MGPITLNAIEECAPKVAAVTMAAIVQQESGGNPLALHDNTTGQSYRPASLAEAARLARTLIQAGHSVDLGLAQINSRNLPALGLDADQVFAPCSNLRAAQVILLGAWSQSGGSLRGALSAYNTGNATGITGARYSARVYAQAGVVVPAIPGGILARWIGSDLAQPRPDLPPVQPRIAWMPEASPLAPNGSGLGPKW
ncbi:MAG: lytic transglycosylase domain-containing protein [Betaproteobacteria bacterium]|nr:lytic transglycosylase domain-containing protein [Betaproteobacteria bacterium]